MIPLRSALAATLLILTPPPGLAQGDEARFPLASPLEVGLSPDGVEALGALVQGFVDRGEIVGGELLLIQDGKTVLHRAYGWRDRDEERPMEPGTVFCVRSMTKPVVGAAIRMLIEDDLLELGDPVAEFLPSFDRDGARDITVEHLLFHTSGLPLSWIMNEDPRELESLRAVADLIVDRDLEFDPGSEFRYSDQGTDTLTALIEVITGRSADHFVRERILEPLGMAQSRCIFGQDDELRPLASSKYGGGPGNWVRFWEPSEAPLFPIFLGSQGLYSTVEDYARFLDLWMRRGRVGKQRLIRPLAVRRTLEPGPFPLGAPSGFPGLRADYGSLMQLWTGPVEEGESEEREVVVFGHTGSDGTHAWAFPEQKAMVLYFTQSRGTMTGLRVEEMLGELLLGVPFDPIQAAPPLEPLLGYYWEGEGDLYRAIVRDGGGLGLEILGKGVVSLVYIGEDRWKFRDQPGTVLTFDRGDDREVLGYHIGEHSEYRFEPSASLPTAEGVLGKVASAHRLDRLETLGPMHVRSRLGIEGMSEEGSVDTWLGWPHRWRYDERLGEALGEVAFDGSELRLRADGKAIQTFVEGPAAELLRNGNPWARFCDPLHWHGSAEIVQRIERGGNPIVLLRLGDPEGPATTLYVHEESGRLVRVDGMTHIEGAGRLGQRLTFGDYRDVEGVSWPHRTDFELATPLIGTMTMEVESIEFGVQLEEGWFELRD